MRPDGEIIFPDSDTTRNEAIGAPPRSAEQVRGWVRGSLGFSVPSRALIRGHHAPLDYLAHAFLEAERARGDCIVWANRGGGKTQLGAIATLLDLVFKPGVQVRILAGSFEQSSKMFRYLKDLLQRESLARMVAGNITGRFVELRNGSRVEVLSQSEASVRGQRIHKLRCDEVELFDDEIWSAAQMTTRSETIGGQAHGAVEAISTMHRPFGLMQRLLDESAHESKRVSFKWNVIDVLERCPPERACGSCPLWSDCGGRARRAEGFVRIDDAIAQMERTSIDTWKSEMLCERPSVRDLVYPEFDESVHLREMDAPPDDERFHWLGGMDFGYRSPTVLLWAVHDVERDELSVIDEQIASERTAGEHIAMAESRPWPHPRWVGADPAGHARSEHTGDSTITLWKRAGWRIRTARTTIEAGVEAVRARIRAADGGVRLFIHPRCEGLIRALRSYHFDPERVENREPVKDGPDHACDALRYLIVNLDWKSGAVRARVY